jgi:hypothetical protein
MAHIAHARSIAAISARVSLTELHSVCWPLIWQVGCELELHLNSLESVFQRVAQRYLMRLQAFELMYMGLRPRIIPSSHPMPSRSHTPCRSHIPCTSISYPSPILAPSHLTPHAPHLRYGLFLALISFFEGSAYYSMTETKVSASSPSGPQRRPSLASRPRSRRALTHHVKPTSLIRGGECSRCAPRCAVVAGADDRHRVGDRVHALPLFVYRQSRSVPHRR